MIELQQLTKTFGPIRAVDNLSLKVPAGATVGFLGPNGAGKTTTIKILTNLISATSGKAFIEGIDVISKPKEAMKNVGAVVETPEFYPYLTPDETLAYLGRIRGMSTAEIKRRSGEVLDQVKLSEWRTTRVGKFSKGMKQRLAIAQALLHEPEVLILDEPTSGLDPRGMVEVREIIRTLKRQQYTIFMSSHLLGEVQEVCDSAALIDRGRLMIYDSIENLKRITRRVKIEVAAIDDVPDVVLGRLREMKHVALVERTGPNVFVVSYEGSVEDRADLLLAVQAAGLKVTGFSLIGLPLEAIYMDVVKETR